MNKKKILITGNAGFIGMHLFDKLMPNYQLVGVDNLNDYYDVNLKISRLNYLGFHFNKELKVPLKNKHDSVFYYSDITDKKKLKEIFDKHEFDFVIHLAAQVGVRYSISNPEAYVKSNIDGLLNILELCKDFHIKHLIYASSSSVYGLNTKMPFSVNDPTDHPISIYGATKKANELMAHVYSHLYQLPTTGLRFFTVYGPYGRPDMAIFKFTKNILEWKPIEVFNNGEMKRDFTYVDDICESIEKLITLPPIVNSGFDIDNPIPSQSSAPYRIFNIGNQQPINLIDFINAIEKSTGKKAILDYKPLQPGDVLNTFADVDDLYKYINFLPKTNIQKGVDSFVKWYLQFYNEV